MSDETRKRYPSDLTDEQWELIEAMLPRYRPNKKGGRPRTVDMRLSLVSASMPVFRSHGWLN